MEGHPRRMVQLYSPRNEPDLLILRSLFDDAGLRYYVRNDTFGSLYMGPHVEAYNRKILCVSETDLDEATALLGEFLERTGREAAEPPPHRGPLDRLLHRLLGWLAPPEPEPPPPPFRLIRGGGQGRRVGGGPDRPRPRLYVVGRR